VLMTELLSFELCLHRVESSARHAHLGLKFLHSVESIISSKDPPCSSAFVAVVAFVDEGKEVCT